MKHKVRWALSLPFWAITLSFYLLGVPFLIIARWIDPYHDFP